MDLDRGIHAIFACNSFSKTVGDTERTAAAYFHQGQIQGMLYKSVSEKKLQSVEVVFFSPINESCFFINS